jgi:hypothetical protein
MANDDRNNPRRNFDRPEDNPFIVFRRFADSQVSSLLNTVFTLPATIAGYNNAHSAREQCLFGKADRRQCETLLELEKQAAEIRHQGQELYRAGDVQAVLKKSEEFVKLDRQADELRRDILISSGDSQQTQLVERVGNEKGQEWGWSQSWGWPGSLEDERAVSETALRETYDLTQLEKQWNEFESQMKRWLRDETMRALWGDDPDDSEKLPHQRGYPRATTYGEQPNNYGEEEWHDTTQQRTQNALSDSWVQPTQPHSSSQAYHTHPYSPVALEADEQLKHIPWRDAFQDLIHSEYGASHQPPNQSHSQWTRRFSSHLSQPSGDPSDESDAYAHDHSDQHEDAPLSTHDHTHLTSAAPATELDAYEHVLAPTPQSSPILSTLTTTQRSTAPDGTVTTKVVLKKRFADGREECEESVHTQHCSDATAQGSGDAPGKKGGWFWSR